MGKNHKHKKQLKSERGKTKLRVKNEKTKFLPKGLNVTKTDFKIKPIVLPEQLKRHTDDELLSKRKLNMKDILTRLKHHNVKVKHDSCDELKYFLVHHLNDIVDQHLSQILHGISPLVLDKEKQIRKVAIKILNCLLENAPFKKLEPFFPVLSSYLRCAMTNIDKSIQEDSLSFLDVLLDNAAGLVAKSRAKILPNLFALISKLKTDSKPGRTLTVNLGSKVTSVKWRVQVLSRLHSFLRAIIAERQSTEVKCDRLVRSAVASHCLGLVYDPYAVNRIDLGALRDEVEVGGEDVVLVNLKTLMSLLYEIWLEVAPELDSNPIANGNTLLSSDSAAVLTCILNILYLLEEYLGDSKEMCKEMDCQNFMKNISQQFPFTQPQMLTGKKNKEQKLLNINSDPKCLQENLIICHLFANFNARLNVNSLKFARKILNYIEGYFNYHGNMSEHNLSYLTACLRVILIVNAENWMKARLDLSDFLAKLIHYFKRSKFKPEVFQLLCDVAQVSHLNRAPTYQQFLSDLPNYLLRSEISAGTIETLLLIAKQNNESFLSELRNGMATVLANFARISIQGSGDKFKILYLFYYVQNLRQEEKLCLLKFSENCDEMYRPTVEYILSK